MRDDFYYRELVERYKAKTASDEELMVFFHLLKEGQLDQYLGDSFLEGTGVNTHDEANVYEMPRLKRSRTWPRVAIAASFAGIVSLVAFLFWNEHRSSEKNAALAGTKPANEQPAYQTISTRRGQQSQAVLPDGTRVWLNAASTLRYRPTFTGGARTVELDGECYFEVAQNSSKPFTVKMSHGIEIKVLGTHFNVHAYRDEQVRAVLIEGSIQMQTQQGAAILKPGEEAVVQGSGELKINDGIDIEAVLAWKNGLFHFNKADIVTVMRQIEKWYDVEVVFEGKVPDKQFVGKVSRNSDISEVLEILKLSNVNFRMEGKKIIVMP